MQTETPLLTVDDWLRHDVPEGFRAELVDGEIEMTPLAERNHQRVLFQLTRQFGTFLDRHPEISMWWSSPCRFPIPGTEKPRGREPDLGLYSEAPAGTEGVLGWKEALPHLVVEIVSPGQEKRDYVDKRLDYHKAGIPEYWILDDEQRLFSALRRTGQGWDETLLELAGTYSTPLLPGFTLLIEKLWT